MFKQLIAIGLGGAIGSVLRYLVQLGLSRISQLSFPLGTFIVNILGCFLIGLFYAFFEKNASLSVDWRLFLITGLCGGFTTFSTYSYESLQLIRQGNYLYFFLYVIMSVALGLFATLGGLLLVRG